MKGILRRNDYAFIDKHRVIDEIRTAIQDSGEPVEHIARSAHVSPWTIYAWLSGATKKPYAATVEAVAYALGLRLTLIDEATVERTPAAPQRLLLPPPRKYGKDWRRDRQQGWRAGLH